MAEVGKGLFGRNDCVRKTERNRSARRIGRYRDYELYAVYDMRGDVVGFIWGHKDPSGNFSKSKPTWGGKSILDLAERSGLNSIERRFKVIQNAIYDDIEAAMAQWNSKQAESGAE